MLWQQTLLAFVQHYKAEISAPQRDRIKALLREKRGSVREKAEDAADRAMFSGIRVA